MVKDLSVNLALTLLLFLAGVGIPIVGILCVPLALHPPLALGIQYGAKVGGALLLPAVLVLYFIGGTGLALSYAVLAAMMVPLLFSFGRAMAVELRVVAGAACGLLAAFAFLMTSFQSVSALYDAAGQVLRENLAASLALYTRVGFSEQDIERLAEHVPAVVKTVLSVMPAATFTAFAIVVLVNLAVLARRFPAHRPWLLSQATLREWRSPEPMVWLFIAAGFLYVAASSELLKTMALNCFLVSLAFYFFQGLAIVSYYFHHKKVPFFLRGLGYALLAFEQVITLALIGMGLFDLWVDFRGLKKKEMVP